MPQLRQDLVTGRWVAIATDRAKRPSSFTRAAAVPVQAGAQCPFCPGHESMTPPEVLAYRPGGGPPNGTGWDIRVVPNLYPAFGPEFGELHLEHQGPYTIMNGLGVHEVIITNPSHGEDIPELPVDDVDLMVRAWIERMEAHANNPILKYLLLINNHGKEAGASLEHPHSQLFGIPVLPPVVEEELTGIKRYREEHGRCAYCEVIVAETAARERIIFENERFLAYAPFASRTPFEAQIIPKWHTERFEDLSPDDRRGFSVALRSLLSSLKQGLNDPPFNFFIHTAPIHDGQVADYHWHLELLPKLAIAAGFELGSGIMINVTTPEAAAEFLRGIATGEPAKVDATQTVH